MSEALQGWRRLSLISYFLLFLNIAIWFFIASPPANKTFALLSIIYLLILSLPWPSLVAANPRVYLWSSYLILLYFVHAVVESYANVEYRGFALAELSLTIIYFISATLCYRYNRQISKNMPES